MKCIYCAAAFILTILAFPSVGQKSRVITGNFQGVAFDEFIRQVESQTPYYFYYDPAQFDSLTVTAELANEDLPVVLDSIFLYTDYHYFVSPEDKVFLTRGREIRTEF